MEALGLLGDGRLHVAGSFTQLGGTFVTGQARLAGPAMALSSLQFAGGELRWLCAGAGPEFVVPPRLRIEIDGFPQSEQDMTRIAGGWSRGGIAAAPAGSVLGLRVLAQAASHGTLGNGIGRIEALLLVPGAVGAPLVFANGFE